jgi:hypothetical protein
MNDEDLLLSLKECMQVLASVEQILLMVPRWVTLDQLQKDELKNLEALAEEVKRRGLKTNS